MLPVYVMLLGVLVEGDLLCENGATLQPSTAMLTCDGVMTVYVDGIKLNNKTANYTIAQSSTIPTGSSILAIHAYRPSHSPKILGAINVSIVTASKGWLCTSQYYSAWNSKQFVDPSWAPAVAYGKNAPLNIPFGKIDDISNTAEWIGTKNATESLYCRFSLCPPRANVCLSLRTTRVDNHRLVGSVFHTMNVQNVGECAMKCHAEHDRCQSFNYITSTKSCELNESKSKTLTPAPGVTYFYRSN